MDRLAFERSLALHEAVALLLREHPSLVSRARERVDRWRQSGTVASLYVEQWESLLQRPVEDLTRGMTAPTEEAHELRQVSPFAGALDPRTRWRIRREVRERLGSA
jgi:hypothetical protein